MTSLALVAACSLGNFGDFSSGDGATGGADAGQPDGSAPTTPGGPDEAGAAADSGVDAGPPPCPSNEPGVILCEDFERPDAVTPFGWEAASNNGTLAMEPGIGMRGSHGLRAKQNDGLGNWVSSSGLNRPIENAWPVGRTYTIELDVKVLSSQDHGFHVVEAIWDDRAWGAQVYNNLECPNGTTCMSWGDAFVPAEAPNWNEAFTHTIGQWHHVVATITNLNDMKRGTLSIDGRVVRESAISTGGDPATVYLVIGALYGYDVNEVILDDVVVRRSGL